MRGVTSTLRYDNSKSSWSTLAWNVAGAVVIITWTACTMAIYFGALRFFKQLSIVSGVDGDTRAIDELTHREKAYVFSRVGAGGFQGRVGAGANADREGSAARGNGDGDGDGGNSSGRLAGTGRGLNGEQGAFDHAMPGVHGWAETTRGSGSHPTLQDRPGRLATKAVMFLGWGFS